jgi:hypothetical protein
MTGMVSGYSHRDYAESLSGFGAPLQLPRCQGWLLRRQIPASDHEDAMGPYPMFSCPDWSGLRGDLDNLSPELVSLALVTDPFGDFDVAYLKECFEDVVVPFKEHFVTDLSRAPETFVSAHHLRNIRKSLRDVRVEHIDEPLKFLDVWTSLYETLIARHSITGITGFSRTSFAKQLVVPGIACFSALHRDQFIGMVLWYVQADVAYYHLAAYNDLGYELKSSFALFSYCLEYFRQQGIKWLNLGAGAGAGVNAESGLARFKAGWATGTRTAYFCGRVFDRARYEQIVKTKGIQATDYFPAYRQGEFG